MEGQRLQASPAALGPRRSTRRPSMGARCAAQREGLGSAARGAGAGTRAAAAAAAVLGRAAAGVLGAARGRLLLLGLQALPVRAQERVPVARGAAHALRARRCVIHLARTVALQLGRPLVLLVLLARICSCMPMFRSQGCASARAYQCSDTRPVQSPHGVVATCMRAQSNVGS